MFNKKIGICIPVYNNVGFLKDNLSLICSTFKNNNEDIPKIFVSDNCSTDGLDKEICQIENEFPNVVYQKNARNLGLDRNIRAALDMCDCPYAWLLGVDDSIRGELSELFEILKDNGGVDIIINGKNTKIAKGIYTDKKYIFETMSYQCNWMSGLIFSKNFLSKSDFSRYYDSYWAHTGGILKYMANNDFSLYYKHNENVFQLNGNQTSWEKDYYKITLRSWADMIMSFEEFDYESKVKCCRNGKQYGRMSITTLLSLRAKGAIDYKMIKSDYEYIRLYNPNSKYLIKLISLTPISPLSMLRRIYIRLFNIK